MSKSSKIEKVKENKAKSWLLEKINKMYKLLVKLIKGKKNERENTIYQQQNLIGDYNYKSRRHLKNKGILRTTLFQIYQQLRLNGKIPKKSQFSQSDTK